MNFLNNFYSSAFYLWDEFFVSHRSRTMALTWLMFLELLLFWLLYELVKKYLHIDLAFGTEYNEIYFYLIGGAIYFVNMFIYNKKKEKVILSNFYKKSRFERKLWVLGSLSSLVLLVVLLFHLK